MRPLRSCLILLTTLLVGCGQTIYKPAPGGLIAPEGAVIRAEDGSFELAAGTPFSPPFQMKCAGSDKEVKTGKINVANVDEWIQGGARRVRVALPGREEALFGVLALCQLEQGAIGAAAEAVRIQIGAEEREAVEHGLIVALAEKVSHNRPGFDAWRLGWVLFLHDRPFPPAPDPARRAKAACDFVGYVDDDADLAALQRQTEAPLILLDQAAFTCPCRSEKAAASAEGRRYDHHIEPLPEFHAPEEPKAPPVAAAPVKPDPPIHPQRFYWSQVQKPWCASHSFPCRDDVRLLNVQGGALSYLEGTQRLPANNDCIPR